MRSVFLTLVLSLAFAVSSFAGAQADTPLDLLGVEKSINDISRRAQETGDAVAVAFADQALKVIAAWKKANGDLIDKTFDKLDDQSKKLWSQLNDVATRIEKGETVTFIDLQRTMATAGATI